MKIAVIETNRSLLEQIQALLNGLPDCEPVIFDDPVIGERRCIDGAPDMILIDHCPPDMDGLAFIEAFRRDSARPDTPIVMISDGVDRDLLYRALNIGASDFLRRPIDRSEFLARIRNLLKLSQSRTFLANRAEWLAEEVRTVTRTMMEREREAIMVLSRAAEYRDHTAAGHLYRMAAYCRLIAEGLGLPSDQVELIHSAAAMHDVGKIGIPDRILMKPGPLDSQEMAIMQQHPEIGASILNGRSELLTLATEIARSHHERYDGAGYPDGLAGEAIPLSGRIAALADVFDALTSKRPFKEAWDVAKAFDYVEANAGTQFDPQCVMVFRACRRQIRDVVGKIESTY
jgi:putative two-component system response regulator